MRRAHTLPEVALTLALVALLAATAVPTVSGVAARSHLHAATADIVNALVLTREAALARGTTAVFAVHNTTGEIVVTSAGDTLAHRTLTALHGVTLIASGDSVRYAPDGLATGVSNTTILIARGEYVDSVVVSRLGRVRW